MQNLESPDELNKHIIQPIIDNIIAGQTEQALQAIEALDTAMLDKIIVVENSEDHSILKTAIEHDASAIIKKLIEKNCNLAEKTFRVRGATLDALGVWFNRTGKLTSGDIPAAVLDTGKALIEALFPKDGDILKLWRAMNPAKQEWEPSTNTPAILYNLLGKEQFVQFLFN